MNQETLQTEILTRLYEAWVNNQMISFESVISENNWSKMEFSKTVERMEHENLIEPRGSGQRYEIKAKGIIQAEQLGIAKMETRHRNELIRTQILNKLAEAYEEQEPYADVADDQLGDSETDELYANLHLLLDLGYLKAESTRSYRITPTGYDAATDLRKKVFLTTEFERISNLSPQIRGREFQKLLAKVVEQDGWLQEEGTRTSNEEMDVIVFREREYYLIECKWEKKSVESSVVRELHGKLANRVDVRGIIVSLSGFARGVTKQVEDYTSSRLILLFGPEDVNSLVYQRASFSELLNGKYRELVTRRKAIFS
jgi:predicted transcriptional regulator